MIKSILNNVALPILLRFMKALAAIFFLQLVILKAVMPAMDTFELAKIPALAEHYHEHQKLNPGISLWDFLLMHYENPNHHAEDHQKHSNLPYGNQHHDANPLQVWYAGTEFSLLLGTDALRLDIVSAYRCPTSTLFQSSIWQPPRMA